MAERWVTVKAPGGLHARLAARIVQLARGTRGRLYIEHQGRRAEASSLASLLALGVDAGNRLRIASEGEGAEGVLKGIATVLMGGVSPGSYAGDGVSPGIATGRAVATTELAPGMEDAAAADDPRRAPEERDQELGRLHAALDRARFQIAALEAWAEREIGASGAFLRAERELLHDPAWLELLEHRVCAQGLAAEAAVWSLSQDPGLLPPGSGRPSNSLREVLRDVGQRLARILLHLDVATLEATGGPMVLVVRQASPSELLEWPREQLAGVVAALGGAQAHAALLARALDLPMVVGVGEDLVEALAAGGRPGPLVTVDGDRGVVWVEAEGAEKPTSRALGGVRRPSGSAQARGQPAIMANADTPEDVRRALDAGAEGIGLARTERVFLGRELPPDEEEQYWAFRALADACGGRALTLRLADLGGSKAPPYLTSLLGSQSLGWRGASLLARHPEVGRPHLRALARVAAETPLTIMVPMVVSRSDLDAILSLWREAAGDAVSVARLSLLVETPAAALEVDRLLSGISHVAIGTNDLTALLFGADRERGPTVARPALQPVTLRAVADVVQSAHAVGVPVAVCGEAAGLTPEAIVLRGLGVDELSVAPERIATLLRVREAAPGHEAARVARALLAEQDLTGVVARLDAWRQGLVSQGITLLDWPEGWEGRDVEHLDNTADHGDGDRLGSGVAPSGQDGVRGTTDRGAEGPGGARGDGEALW